MSNPPVEIPLGAMRFNSDSQKLEYWNGSIWMQVHTFSPNLATSSDNSVGARGMYMGGVKNQQPSPVTTNEIDYYNIAAAGNAQDFGDLTTNMYSGSTGNVASTTRGFVAGSSPNPGINTINRITFSSTGSAADYGDMTNKRYVFSAHSSATRGLFMGGYVHPAYNNAIDYITMATDGNAADFGDLSSATGYGAGGGNPTRAFQFGGVNFTSSIIGVTIQTLGNSISFGNLTNARQGAPSGVSNSTRVLIGGGNLSPSNSKTSNVELYLSTSGGNATSFGTLTASRSYGLGGAGDQVRATFAGGYSPSQLNTIDYITFATGGAGVDFGDLNNVVRGGMGSSNAHGGL